MTLYPQVKLRYDKDFIEGHKAEAGEKRRSDSFTDKDRYEDIDSDGTPDKIIKFSCADNGHHSLYITHTHTPTHQTPKYYLHALLFLHT